MDKFVVSNSPYIHSGNDVNKMFLYTAIALMVPAIYGVMFFGVNAFLIIIESISVCFFSECLYNLITKKIFMVEDFSFFVTAMILALVMPIGTPIVLVLGIAFFSIFFVKMAFGGLGFNKFNPALTGRCLAGVVSVGFTSSYYDYYLAGEKIISISSGGTNSVFNLFTGKAVGGIGTTCIIAILICFIALVYLGVIDAKIPIISFVSYFIVSLLFNNIETSTINMFSGSFIFVAVFMMTDPNTSPNRLVSKILYSVLFGGLSALLWNVSALGENTIFAVALFVNLLVPFMDKLLIIKPIKIGGFRNAHKN